MGAIKLVTEVPGPRSRALVARREAAVPNGAAKLTPLGIASGRGSVVVDLDGNELLDLARREPSIVPGVETLPLADAQRAHERLRAGDVPGRLVLVP